jgi:hypothetical protein
MIKSKNSLRVFIVVSLMITVSIVAFPQESDKEMITLRKGTEIYLTKSGNAVFSLDTDLSVEKSLSDGKWLKVVITGWVPASEVPELSSDREEIDTPEDKEKGREKADPIITGEAGPFHVTIKGIRFVDEVKDRFGTLYRSGTEGSFMILDLSVKNNSKKERNIYKANIVLIDGKGRQYKTVGISNDKSFDGGSINPGETEEGYLYLSIFDDSTLSSIRIKGRPCSSCPKYNKVFDLGDLKVEKLED